jgi:hypothetical protein
MPFALIEAGTYTMGSPGSETGRDADETEVLTGVAEFAIGTTEVKQSDYLTVRGLSPSHFSGSSRPVEKVSYEDALAFCAALSARPAEIAMGRSYRLPTEAEWEFACRAGTTTAYNFGANAADLPDNGWFTTNSGAETHDVGGKPANAKGLVDAHGNVWEWCQNSRMDGGATDKVIRGGGWNSTAAECRSASRTLIAETTTRNDIGFRVVMVRSPIPQIGECEYIVTLDDEEVYRATCYEGASCRNPSGDVDVATAYLQGTLRWSKFDPRELALIVDPDTGCRDFFCGTCRCTCECLCVTIVEPDGNVIRGELCTACYPCDAPVWEGTLGYYDLSIALGRDEYTGECIITLTANGEEPDSVFVTGCADMSATITLYDGTIISVVCKQCACEEPLQSCCGCPSFGGNDGCIVFSSRDPCISGDRFDLNWSTGRGGMPASPTTWGTVTCEMFATINMGASIPGCGGADIDFTFVVFRVTDPDPSVASIISDCEWAMEVYADGVYLDMYIEYTNECQSNGVDDPLAWIQFPNVDIGGLGTATVTSDFTIPNTKC